MTPQKTNPKKLCFPRWQTFPPYVTPLVFVSRSAVNAPPIPSLDCRNRCFAPQRCGALRSKNVIASIKWGKTVV